MPAEADASLVPVPVHLRAQCGAFIAEQLQLAADFGPTADDGPLARDLLDVTAGLAFVGFDPALMIEDQRTFSNGRSPRGVSDGFEAVAAAIGRWLRADASRLLILEDSIQKRSDTRGADAFGTATVSASGDTLYECLASATSDHVHDAIARQFPYPGIGVLTSHAAPLPKEMPRALIAQLAANAEALVIQAFDGEGLLLGTIEGRTPPAFVETVAARPQ